MKERFAFRITFSFLLVVAGAFSSTAQDRTIAIGDVHGSYSQFVGILQQVGLIDASRRWIGGSATLVQTGDVPDRGPRTRECLDLLMALEQQAPQQSGKVIPLLGNHEVMVMAGDFRYTTHEDFLTFANERSEARREEAYREFRAFVGRNPRRREAFGAVEAAGRQKWMDEHPLGFFEFRDAFGPQGVYGKWLRRNDAVTQVAGVIFLHGGLSPKFRFRDIREVNERIRSEIRRFDELWGLLVEKKVIWRYMTFREAIAEIHSELKAEAESLRDQDQAVGRSEMREFAGMDAWAIISPDGPLWYRGFAVEPEGRLKPFVEKTLARFNAQHFVVGHTSLGSQRIRPRAGNRVLLIDTAMIIDGRGGRTSALEIRNETFTAHYSGGEQQVLLGSGTRETLPDAGQGSAN